MNKQVANLTNKKHLLATGKIKWTTSPVGLIFGYNFELLAVAEVHAYSDGKKKFAEIIILEYPDRGSVNPSPLGDGSQCKDELFSNNYPGYERLNSFSLRDACMDAGGRAKHGAIAGKARMRGYESGRNTYDLIPSP